MAQVVFGIWGRDLSVQEIYELWFPDELLDYLCSRQRIEQDLFIPVGG